ncbi:MAG: hypothetical protein A3J38_09840 [Gammaproteobacteria bacterium RIFCSPHIGHO2_12_FULL_45_9]|nr:MAG: hypothetical protein A3J38_09840 [Gammaproteobacteria bacterium RIFCSPHIGHO2_12_FULL_45_9]
MSDTYIPRFYKALEDYCRPGKVLVIYGPRQVGKTTLIKQFLAGCALPYRLDSGDNVLTRTLLSGADFKTIRDYVAGFSVIVIDEAQKIEGIGECLKIMVDQMPDLRIIVSGSSSFELAGQIGEPLTGRKTTLTLFPIAQLELQQTHNLLDLKAALSDYLIYGAYPEVVQCDHQQAKQDAILEITGAYLFKDILELDKIKSSKTLVNLLRLLALQIGSEVSLSELAQQLMLDAKTVKRYLDILEKAFVIYPLHGFSRNLRKEMTKKSKYYFYDVGIRNALIANFNALSLRNDVGALWENFIFMERVKRNAYLKIPVNYYFWRTWNQKEIDLIEERGGALYGYEFKWAPQSVRPIKEWIETYENAYFDVVHRDNYLNFVGSSVVE